MFSPLLKATAKDTGVDLTEGLVAHYLLNNNADDCQGTYDGTPTDVDFQGDVGYFNGTTSNIAIPSLGFGTSFSFGFWVYTNDNTVEQRIVAYNDTTDGVFFIGRILATGKFNLYVKSATTLNIDSTTTPANGTMYHIFGNINESGTCELFVDSISENSDTVGAFTVAVGDRYIGANRLGEVHNTDGGISNIRFYSTTKDQTEIDAIYAEGYYPKPLPLPTTTNLVAHYPLTGTAEDTTGNYDGTENSATYKDDVEFGSVYDGGGSITVNTTATGLASWCCYWKDTGSGFVFIKSTIIPSTLTTDDYRNLRLYSATPSTTLQDEIEVYEKNFRHIDIDDGLMAYYSLANNSLDNYYNEYDGTDTDMNYDGLSGVFNGTTSNIKLPLLGFSQKMAVSMWVKFDSIANDPKPFGYGSFAEANMFSLGYSSGKLVFHLLDTGAEVVLISTTTIITGVWYHIIITAINNGECTLSINTIEEDSDTSGTWKYSSEAYDEGYVGSNRTGTGAFVDGEIAKVRAYNKIPTQDKIDVIYNTEKGDFE